MAGREPLDPIPNSNVKSPSAYDTVAISRGKVGRRQAFSYTLTSHSLITNTHTTNKRGVEQPGSSSGS